MSHLLDRRIQLLTLFLLAFVALFTLPSTALADDAVLQGDTIANGETVENDVLLTGTDISLNGTVAGDALVLGRTIVINGDVEGSMLVLGENVIMNGHVEGSVYSIAVSYSLLSDASIGRSLYFLGISLLTEKESAIGTDLTAVTLGARQAGHVGRDTKIISGLIEIGRLILDRVNAVTTGKSFGDPLPQTESSSIVPQIGQSNIFAASIGPVGSSPRTIVAQEDPPEEDAEDTAESNTFADWLVGRLRELITYLLIGGLFIWLFPNLLDNWANQVRKKPLVAGGWGLVAYVVGFIAHLIFFLLILVVGISFAFVTLWGLAWAWWGVGFSALALAFSLFLVAIAFISKIIVAYLFGRLIFERFGSQPDMRKPWPLLVGLIIYVLLCGIPYLGWAISLVVTFLGLGAIWLSFVGRNDRSQKIEGSQISA
jgi:hypothetical protein